MKSKQLAILFAIAVILGGVIWFLNRDNKDSTGQGSGAAGKKVLDFPIDDVEQVVIQSSAGSVNLAKKDGTWKVLDRADYPADFVKISDLSRKLFDMKTVQTVAVGPSQYARLELVEPAAGAAGSA